MVNSSSNPNGTLTADSYGAAGQNSTASSSPYAPAVATTAVGGIIYGYGSLLGAMPSGGAAAASMSATTCSAGLVVVSGGVGYAVGTLIDQTITKILGDSLGGYIYTLTH